MTSVDAPLAEPTPSPEVAPEAVHLFDARGVARRFRHAAIFGALEALAPGEVMRFLNDHDPLPLLRQMEQRYGEALEVTYRHKSEQGVVIDFFVRG